MARLGDPLRVRAVEVVGDGVRALEALLGEALLEGQGAAIQPELDVVLAGHLPDDAPLVFEAAAETSERLRELLAVLPVVLLLPGGVPAGVLNTVHADGPTTFEGLTLALEAERFLALRASDRAAAE